MLSVRPRASNLDCKSQALGWSAQIRDGPDSLSAVAPISVLPCVAHDLWSRLVAGLFTVPATIPHGFALAVSTGAGGVPGGSHSRAAFTHRA